MPTIWYKDGFASNEPPKKRATVSYYNDDVVISLADLKRSGGRASQPPPLVQKGIRTPDKIENLAQVTAWVESVRSICHPDEFIYYYVEMLERMVDDAPTHGEEFVLEEIRAVFKAITNCI